MSPKTTIQTIVDNAIPNMLYYSYCPQYVPLMVQKEYNKHQNEVLIKFRVPRQLKLSLQDKANERNITVSALLRLITSEYVKRTQ